MKHAPIPHHQSSKKTQPQKNHAPDNRSSATRTETPGIPMFLQAHAHLTQTSPDHDQNGIRFALPRCVSQPKGSHPTKSNESASHGTIVLQPKLAIGEPGDIHEQEADQIAERVMRTAEPAVQRQVEEEEEEEEELVQTKPLIQRRDKGHSPGHEAPPLVHETLRSPGHALDASTRTFMERRFGQDFSQVRVHTDAQAAESAQAINARAYTVDRNIVFGPGEYAPSTREGQRLLAHELTHVVQQQHSIHSSMNRSQGENVIRRQAAAGAAAMGAAEWIGLGAAGYAVAHDAVKSTAGDISYTFDEMEGVLLPGGGNNVAEYRRQHPDANIRTHTHSVSVWIGTSGSRKMGIKFGITFNYDGHAIGNISCRILDTYDWPMWSGSVNVNLTPLSLARGDVATVRITINVNADVTFRGGLASSAILELDGTGTLRDVSGRRPYLYLRFNE